MIWHGFIRYLLKINIKKSSTIKQVELWCNFSTSRLEVRGLHLSYLSNSSCFNCGQFLLFMFLFLRHDIQANTFWDFTTSIIKLHIFWEGHKNETKSKKINLTLLISNKVWRFRILVDFSEYKLYTIHVNFITGFPQGKKREGARMQCREYSSSTSIYDLGGCFLVPSMLSCGCRLRTEMRPELRRPWGCWLSSLMQEQWVIKPVVAPLHIYRGYVHVPSDWQWEAENYMSPSPLDSTSTLESFRQSSGLKSVVTDYLLWKDKPSE